MDWPGIGQQSTQTVVWNAADIQSVVRVSVGKNYMDFKKTEVTLQDIKMYHYHMFLEVYMEVSVINNIEIWLFGNICGFKLGIDNSRVMSTKYLSQL